MKKKILILLMALITAFSLATFTACDKSSDQSENGQEEAAVNAYKATFTTDDNVSVYFYSSQDYSEDPTAATYAYSKDGDTGDYLKDGTGQVNFKLVFEEGYCLDDVEITGSYGNLKLPDEVGTADVYRITKIADNITVSVTSKEETAVEDTSNAFAIDFTLPEHVSIVIYDRQYLAESNTDAEGMTGGAVGYARRDSTGKLLTDGNGQINFKLICEEGYEIDEISINGTYKNLKTPSDTKVSGVYRITKIESALEVTVTEAETSDEEDYTDAYEVTFEGDHCTVYVYKTQDTTEDVDAATVGYARDSSTGKLDNSGNGQINFTVVAEEGYSIESVNATPAENYKNLKEQSEGVYRITKISGAVTVIIACVAN